MAGEKIRVGSEMLKGDRNLSDCLGAVHDQQNLVRLSQILDEFDGKDSSVEMGDMADDNRPNGLVPYGLFKFREQIGGCFRIDRQNIDAPRLQFGDFLKNGGVFMDGGDHTVSRPPTDSGEGKAAGGCGIGHERKALVIRSLQPIRNGSPALLNGGTIMLNTGFRK